MAKIELEIIGCDVHDLSGNLLGTVASVQIDEQGVFITIDTDIGGDDDDGEPIEEKPVHKLRAVGSSK